MDDTTQPNATPLTPQQERAAEMIAAGSRVGDVAEALGVDRTTVWRWTRLPEFERFTNELRRLGWRAAADRMRSNACLAAETLADVLADPGTPPRDRVAAARTVIAATGPMFSPLPRDRMPDMEARGVPPLEHDWRAIMIDTAERAARMNGHLFVEKSTPAAAWVGSGLEEAFAGSFQHLRSLAADPERLRLACEDLLARFEDLVNAREIAERDAEM